MPRRTIAGSATSVVLSSITCIPSVLSWVGSWVGRCVGLARTDRPTRSLLEQGGLVGALHLGGEVDVSREVLLAADRARLGGHRVLEQGCLELLRRGRRASGRQGDGPLHGQPGVVVPGRH